MCELVGNVAFDYDGGGPIQPCGDFKWIEWNIQKIAAHGLSAEEVEESFDRMLELKHRNDESFQMRAELPNGRHIIVVWRFDREDDEIPDVFGDLAEPAIFVITAY